ncbi:MAG: tyrosine-type recombinase/integrase [Terriglobia bacterium]
MSVTVEVPRTTAVGPLLQMFFTEHLWNHKRVSPCTVKSYRDTFRLLLQYAEKTTVKQPSALSTTDLDAPMILAFLESLEQERHNLPASRNIRLTAIRSFFRFVALRDPASVGVATRVLAIPSKRTDKGLMGFLTRPEIDAILANHDLSKWSGRRDHVLLLTLYNTGARVSEITSLRRNNFSLGVKSYVQFLGKGRKERSVPLWFSTARAVRAWFSELNPGDEGRAFPNARNGPLTRDGVNYVLQRAIERASPNCPSLSKKSISPHTIRHYVPFLTMSSN